MSDHYRKQAEERRAAWVKKWDTDGDGKVGTEERKVMMQDYRDRAAKRRKEMDADGDGRITAQESTDYRKKVEAKYDADGDGELNSEERQKMYQQEYGGSYGGWGYSGGRPGTVRAGSGQTETIVNQDGTKTVILRVGGGGQ